MANSTLESPTSFWQHSHTGRELSIGMVVAVVAGTTGLWLLRAGRRRQRQGGGGESPQAPRPESPASSPASSEMPGPSAEAEASVVHSVGSKASRKEAPPKRSPLLTPDAFSDKDLSFFRQLYSATQEGEVENMPAAMHNVDQESRI
mmetsp:Transcript_52970/g.87828  ORF Transcript_52970/g.87828 Transcript_52970/m.87828 type:complete len:147 (-) Transcript_52970:49-489(-)